MTRHALTVDLEDWYQSTVDADAPLTARFEASTEKLLAAFAGAGVQATFFVLGKAAEAAPHLVRKVRAAGHEIQSHGYGHVNVFELTAEQFGQDLRRAKGLLEDLVGTEVFGYRAPSFSIDERTPWAHAVLAETGHRYDSSVFPIKMRRYGVADYPPEPRILEPAAGRRIVEAPIACFDWLGRRRPVGGGGYFRLYPYWVIRKAFRQLDRIGRPGVVYMHPYEYDPSEMRQYGADLPLKVRLHQGLGRAGFAGKIDRLVREFQVGPLGVVLGELLRQVAG